MKVKIDKDLFLSKLSKVIKFVPSKVVIPQFENLLLSIESNIMTIVATDGNIQIKMKCLVNSDSDFSMCVPAKWLFANISLYRENEVMITQKVIKKEERDVMQIDIKCGKSKGNVICDCLPQNYSMMSMKNLTSDITMSQSLLKMAMKTSEKFIDGDSANANYTSMNIAEVDKKIVFTGLTQTVMCRAAVDPISITNWEPIALPTETAERVIALMDDKGEVTITHNKEKICFYVTDVFEVMSVLGAGKFPNSEKIFAARPKTCYVLNTLEFKDAVKRLKLYALPGTSAMVEMILQDGELHMTSRDPMTGRYGEESMSIINPEGLLIDKAYANDHLLSVLGHVDSNEIFFFFDEARQIPSFIVPKVENEKLDVYSFLIANQAVQK